MILRQTAMTGMFTLAVSTMVVSLAQAQTETFTATAAVKSAAAATASAPITIVIERKTAQADADRLAETLKTGGAPALRKALAGVPPTGTVQLGGGAATPTRLTIERTTDKGRLLTIVADQPLLFLGASVPGAKPKTGYDFAIIDIEIDAKGGGAGTLAPAAKIAFKQGTFVVEDYGAELVRLTGVKKTK
jgi:hypothetical protein